MLKNKPRNASFTLEERLNLLRILRTKIKIIDANTTDGQANETKKDAWEYIQQKFIDVHPDRYSATPKEIRELWRRMKHRARMEVRQKVQSAKRGAIPTMNEDDMGWMPDQNHTVVDINDLGLDADTKMITEFVPLLEEEATVLETRNGILQGVANKDGRDRVRTNEQDDAGDVDHAVEIINYEKMVEDNNDEIMYIGDHVKLDRQAEQRPIVHYVQSIDTVASNSGSESQRPTPPPLSPLPVVSSRFQERHPVQIQVDTPRVPISVLNTNSTSKSASEAKLTELSMKYLTEEHEAKMTLIRMQQEAARAKREAARLTQEAARAKQEVAIAKQEVAIAKQEAAKAKRESALAKRSAYDEKRMFYFDKRKKLHSENDSNNSA